MTQDSFNCMPNIKMAGIFLCIMCAVMMMQNVLFADICVWRDPEKTMAKVFPEAKNYRTHVEKIPESILRDLEKRFGFSWDEGELSYIPARGFHFYEILNAKNEMLGMILALAGKGEYGAIEVVIGLEKNGRIIHIYIQRMRERHAKELRDGSFLDQFMSTSAGDIERLQKSFHAVQGAEKSSNAVCSTVEKMLSLHEIFISKGKS